MAVDNAIKKIGIEFDVINWKISAGTVENTKITKEEYEELLRNGMQIVNDYGIIMTITFSINFYRLLRLLHRLF